MRKISSKNSRPYFIWDYDLSEKEVTDILRGGSAFDKQWLITRILESATYEDVWKYVSLKEILQTFNNLKLKQPIKRAWEKAFLAWGVKPN